jgi:hypothetical protein
MGSVVDDIGGLANDLTGQTARDSKAAAQATQNTAKGNAADTIAQSQGVMKQGSDLYGQGVQNSDSASNYWNNWLQNPSAAYQSTLGQAQNIGGANAGMATNNAVNAARGSGLNAGQAALAGGAQSANAFTQNTQNAQGNLMGQQQQSAQGQSNLGANQTNQGLSAQNNALGQENNANANISGIAGQQQNQAQYDKTSNNNLIGGVLSGVGNTLGGGATSGAGNTPSGGVINGVADMAAGG